MISRVGIPKEILTDQGTAFMSRTIRELYELLGIKSIRTSVYHPQTDGLVERFNRTLKTMIRKFVHEDAKNWDKWLEPLLFAVREVPQASTGFSPFELLYGRQPRGVLDVLRETWEEGPSESKIQAWSSLVFHCCHSSFNPSEAPPWDSRPVSGAGVVHYQLLHRPRSVPTALGPAPLATLPFYTPLKLH